MLQLTGNKEFQENKKRLANEVASLKQENQCLHDKLQEVESERDLKLSEIKTLNEKFSALKDEKEKFVQTLKGLNLSCKCANVIHINNNNFTR